ncbi:MAG: type II restriction endonuclease [Candidatus Moranbacteria bacterium]|nr:type II restriction endonuclease [Candidatus Moranbacteria bacterium]
MEKNFENLVITLKNSLKTWDYFVNWEKIFSNSSELEIILNKLNYLLGKEDLKAEFKKLFETNPDIVKAFPVLLAVREKQLEIFSIDDGSSEFFNFGASRKEDDGFEKYYSFLEKSNLINLFKKDGIKNLVDYVIGVEVGLDSNGRKNRGGSLMEKIVESHIKNLCDLNGFEFIAQARATDIRKKWGVEVQVDKSERSFDFAVYNQGNEQIKLFEVNFYNGGGSKLKAVCGEFKSLYDELKRQNIDFVWITDGLGWHTAKRPLEETYNHNEYVFNLHMIEQGVLGELNW